MAIVMDYMNGNARITIHDDYCKDKTEAEIKQILSNIADIAARAKRIEPDKKDII